MEASMEEIIKKIVNLDKSAIEQKKGLEEDIKNRKDKIAQEIEKLREEIVIQAKLEAEALRKSKMESITNEVEAMRKKMQDGFGDLTEKYQEKKDMLLPLIFNEIINR